MWFSFFNIFKTKSAGGDCVRRAVEMWMERNYLTVFQFKHLPPQTAFSPVRKGFRNIPEPLISFPHRLKKNPPPPLSLPLSLPD